METVIAGRLGFEMLGNQYPAAKNVIFEHTSYDNVPCAWLRPEGAPEGSSVVYIHGGAFIYGSLKSHHAMVSHIAAALKRNVLMIDYRLAPEYPFPAGLNDCVSVITQLCKERPGASFGIIGDSAGGNLTIATQVQLKQMGGSMPQYSVVISPWADLECNSESYVRNNQTDTVLSREYLQWAAGLYGAGRRLSDGLLSPVHANLSGLPPALILCGTAEILEDDSLHLHRQLQAAGAATELIAFEDQQHVWPFMDIETVASQKALSDIAAFVTRHSVIPRPQAL